MAPKKKTQAAAADSAQQGAITEVEKLLFQQQIADLNKNIARLRSSVTDYELRYEDLQKSYEKLDEDRADIIAYLKKQLAIKGEENTELKDKVKGLEETLQIERTEFKSVVEEKDRFFKIMKDQLTSENKMMSGKLNTLEEFRAIRDDLMQKYEKLEQDFKDQELKYKRIIYETDKKLVIGKDKLKRDMEARVSQLAQDFQDATELRIAASTHRVIRENIALNNEIDKLLSNQQKLSNQNATLVEAEKKAATAQKVAEEERKQAQAKCLIQVQVIEKLVAAFQEKEQSQAIAQKQQTDFDKMTKNIESLSKENEKLNVQVRILEQNLHNNDTTKNQSNDENEKLQKQNDMLKDVLQEAATSIRAALKLDEWAKKEESKAPLDRQLLLSRVLDILTKYRDINQDHSIGTVTSSEVYKKGDLGFIPKTTKKTSLEFDLSIKESEKTQFSTPRVPNPSQSLSSLQTIPSVNIFSEKTTTGRPHPPSIASFVTSSKSSVSVDEEAKVCELTEMEKKLAESKLNIQRSILKDLEASTANWKSTLHVSDENQETGQFETDEANLDEVDGEGEIDKTEEDEIESQIEGEIDSKDDDG